ncbi:hypothetical protein PoB_007526500 [Plakobranchus ocellatus]|uniref:SMB domain-containing protein n=1 Tax=Plakobranchus ocellatus TaxID=259542 RepID=A0AAV4DX55_9GAST|nr:hypothetical protein PoB_007526500 [Plakobranchus ocellatus]
MIETSSTLPLKDTTSQRSKTLSGGQIISRAMACFSSVEQSTPDMLREQNVLLTFEKSKDSIAYSNLENYTNFNDIQMSTPQQKDVATESNLSFGQVGDEHGLDLSLTFTCEGHCGKKISFPCSCSATCVVYSTCCDNIAHDCPHVWNEGLTRFDQFRKADFICAESSIYIFTTCPKTNKDFFELKEKMEPATSDNRISGNETENFETQNRFSISCDTPEQKEQVVRCNSTGAIGSEKKPEESITSQLFAAIASAPVTDLDTGFTFITKAVYNCHNMPERNALQWAVLLNYSFTSPTKLNDFVQHQSFKRYRPNFNENILTAHICKRKIQGTCNQNADLKEVSKMYAKKCLESNNAVLTSGAPPMFYRNRFCAYCNEGRHNKYKLYLSNKLVFSSGQQFQVLMSLTESNTLSLKLNRPAGDSVGNLKVPWSQAVCPIQDQGLPELVLNAGKSGQGNQALCSVTCDDRRFSLRSDGICKAPHEALLAIPDDGFVPLCPAAFTGLARFIVCALKKEIKGLEYADFSAPSISVGFDSTLNNSFYVVQLHLALPRLTKFIFSYSEKDLSQNVYSVALLVKSFHLYRKSHKICLEREEDKKTSELKVFASSSLINFARKMGIDLPQGLEELRGPIVDDQNKTTVCLTKTTEFQIDPNKLLCMEDPLYERDSTWISRFSNSSCFYHFENLETKTKNIAVTLIESYETLLQCLLSLSFLATTMLLVF